MNTAIPAAVNHEYTPPKSGISSGKPQMTKHQIQSENTVQNKKERLVETKMEYHSFGERVLSQLAPEGSVDFYG